MIETMVHFIKLVLFTLIIVAGVCFFQDEIRKPSAQLEITEVSHNLKKWLYEEGDELYKPRSSTQITDLHPGTTVAPGLAG